MNQGRPPRFVRDPRDMRDRRTMPSIPPTSQPIPPPRMVAPDLMSLVPGVYDPTPDDDGHTNEVRSEITDVHESVTKQVQLLPLGTTITTPVYTMAGEWPAIDIAINVPPSILFGVQSGSAIGVQLFATIGGTRALVASGRYGGDDFASGILQKRLIAFRGGAERFDVQASCNFLANGSDTVQVSMYGARIESAFDDDQELGVMSLGNTDAIGSGSASVSVSAEVPLQLVALIGLNANAASTRYLHVYDKPQGTNVAGLAPLHSFALGPASGPQSGIELFDRILRLRRFQKGILLACSTTPFTTTLGAAGDMGFQAWYR